MVREAKLPVAGPSLVEGLFLELNHCGRTLCLEMIEVCLMVSGEKEFVKAVPLATRLVRRRVVVSLWTCV